MTAYQFCQVLKRKSALPSSTEKSPEPTSNSELRRWFEKSSILINGVVAKIDDQIVFPVHEVVFHPKGKRRTTMGGFDWCEIDICEKCLENS